MHNKSIDDVIQDLAEKQICVWDGAFSPQACEDLLADLERLHQEGAFKQASIGRGAGLQVQSHIRGDATYWLDEHSPSPAQKIFWDFMQGLQTTLNENFFIGLRELEAHYAFYPPGSGYDKHIDQHPGTSHRKVTFILYFNKNWQPNHGGELLVYNPQDPSHLLCKIEPVFARLVLFRSEVFPHQVATCTQNRKSLTGWFRS